MQLIDDRAGKRQVQGLVAFPVVGDFIHHHRLHRHRAVVARTRGGQALIAIPRHGAGVGIKQDLLLVVTQALLLVQRPVRAVGVYLAGAQPLHLRMPVIKSAVVARMQGDDPRRCRGRRVVKEQQLDLGAVFGKDAEVYAVWPQRGAQRVGQAARRGIAGGIAGFGGGPPIVQPSVQLAGRRRRGSLLFAHGLHYLTGPAVTSLLVGSR